MQLYGMSITPPSVCTRIVQWSPLLSTIGRSAYTEISGHSLSRTYASADARSGNTRHKEAEEEECGTNVHSRTVDLLTVSAYRCSARSTQEQESGRDGPIPEEAHVYVDIHATTTSYNKGNVASAHATAQGRINEKGTVTRKAN